jgi:uncharacterized protein GlcG (DUF336 family)
MAIAEMNEVGTITIARSQQVIEAAMRKAEEIGVAMNIAVVDDGGNLKAFVRMEKAWLGSIDIAINKAFTARAFDMSTKKLAKIAQPGDTAFGIHATNGGRVVIFPGGIPLMAGEQVVGAIGVSGGQPDEDHEVAEAGAEAF